MENTMPVIFIGHGSPMNAIEENEFVTNWKKIALTLPRPKAILSVSAHWTTKTISINDDLNPTQIYDMYGFPKELYDLVYPAKGSPEFAKKTFSLLGPEVVLDNDWGIDHGTWSVLCKMYPKADIPVYQLSVTPQVKPESYYHIGELLKPLRKQGVLILGSGNVVHNLSRVNFGMSHGYPWADEFDDYIKKAILSYDHDKVIHYQNSLQSAKDAFYTTEHYYPLLAVLGASDTKDQISVYNDARQYGALSMTSYVFK